MMNILKRERHIVILDYLPDEGSIQDPVDNHSRFGKAYRACFVNPIVLKFVIHSIFTRMNID